MKKPNLTLSLAEAVRIIDQASADSTPQLAIAVAATVLADFARQSLEPQPPVTTGNVVFTEIDHHKRTAVAVPVSQADLQKWQDIITLLTNDISLLLHTGALQMARHIDSLQIRLAEAERVTEEQVLAMRVIGMTDAESLTCIPQADGMLVVSAMDDDGKTYALDLQSLFKALTAARGGG